MAKQLLPIGSVVRLKEATRLIMIFGVLQLNSKDEKKCYDYVGVPYPEGRMDSLLDINFNHDSIEEVVFTGYKNEEYHRFMGILNQLQASN